jgi:hypothetical protein
VGEVGGIVKEEGDGVADPCPARVESGSREGFRRQGQQRGRWRREGLDGVAWADEMRGMATK